MGGIANIVTEEGLRLPLLQLRKGLRVEDLNSENMKPVQDLQGEVYPPWLNTGYNEHMAYNQLVGHFDNALSMAYLDCTEADLKDYIQHLNLNRIVYEHRTEGPFTLKHPKAASRNVMVGMPLEIHPEPDELTGIQQLRWNDVSMNRPDTPPYFNPGVHFIESGSGIHQMVDYNKYPPEYDKRSYPMFSTSASTNVQSEGYTSGVNIEFETRPYEGFEGTFKQGPISYLFDNWDYDPDYELRHPGFGASFQVLLMDEHQHVGAGVITIPFFLHKKYVEGWGDDEWESYFIQGYHNKFFLRVLPQKSKLFKDTEFWESLTVEWDDFSKPEKEGCFVNLDKRYSPRTGTNGLGIYKLAPEQIDILCRDLYVTNLTEKINTFVNGNAVDGIVSLRYYYGINEFVRTSPRDYYLTLGNIVFDGGLGVDSKIITPKLMSEYTVIDLGSVFVERKFNNFLDYSNFTKMEIYLPFYGFVSLNINEFLNSTCRVKYHLNMLSGRTMIQIYTERAGGWRLVEEIPTTMGVEIPFNIQARDSAELKGLMMAAGIAAGGAAMATGPIAGSGLIAGGLSLAGSAAGATSSALSSEFLPSGDYGHRGGIDPEASSMGCFQPFIRFTRPDPVPPPDYEDQLGYPDYRNVEVKEMKGYLKFASVDNRKYDIPSSEMTEIIQLLKGGVYIE